MVDKIVKVAVYARVSTQEQAVEGTSLEHQSEQLEAYCKAQGWEIIQSYIDPGYTGKDDNRPGLKRLLSDAKLNLFSKVVVYKMDRLARNLRLLLEIQDKLEKCGVPFHSVSEVLDSSTTNGRHFLQMLGMIGEWERETIIERTKAGRIQRYKEGRWAGGKPAYGFMYDKNTKKLLINTEEEKVVKQIFHEYKSGKSLAAVADLLNKNRISPRTKTAKGWRPVAIRQILINPAYKGSLIVNRHSNISDIAKIDMAKVITIPVAPMVEDKDWNFAQSRLQGNKAVRPMEDKAWLLQGLIKCGVCGMSFRADTWNRGKYSYRHYECRGKLKQSHLDGSPKCSTQRLKAAWLEEQVWQKIVEVLNDPNKLGPMVKETIDRLTVRAKELEARIHPVSVELSRIANQKAKLADDFVRTNMNQDRYRELQLSLNREEARLKSILGDADPIQLDELKLTVAWLVFWQRRQHDLSWNLENEDGSRVRTVDRPHELAIKLVGIESEEVSEAIQFPATRRRLLDKLQVRLVVFHDRIEINAIFPFEPIALTEHQKYPSTCQGKGVE